MSTATMESSGSRPAVREAPGESGAVSVRREAVAATEFGGVGTAEARDGRPAEAAPIEQPGKRRTRRNLRSNRRGPVGVRPPRMRRRRVPRASGCRVATPTGHAAPAEHHWRLTNRGIAAILVSGAVLAAAALTVITATALTVTSPEHQHPETSIVGR